MMIETILQTTTVGSIHIRPGNINDLGVCVEVHDNDCYEVRRLSASGFKPARILDLGGHVGTFTRLAAKYWPEAIIHIYECEPQIFDILSLNIAGFDRITAHPHCVLGFYREEEGNNIYESNGMERDYRKHRHPCAVSIREVMARIGSVDFLKIDVEQSEVNILRHLDSMDALRLIQVIHGEWHFDTAKNEVRSILGKTHDVELVDEGQWNLFKARLK